MISREWWRDLRNHYPPYLGRLKDDHPILTQLETEQFIEFVKSKLNLASGARMLDLCCGPGSFTVELAKQGFDTVGIDINERFIEYARNLAERRLGDAADNVKFMLGDMRDIPFVNHFDGVVNIGTSFGFFADDADNYQVIENVAKSLKSNGTFLLEVGNRDWYLKNFLERDWHKHDDGRVTIIHRSFDYPGSRIIASFETVGEGAKETWGFSWRVYTLAETIELFKKAGLKVYHVFGGWNADRYSVDSKRMVVVSKKEMPV